MPVGLATSTRCSDPGNLSNFGFQMRISDPAPAGIGAGRVQSRVRSSTSLGSSFCRAGIRVWGLEGGSGSGLSPEMLVESVPAVGVAAGHISLTQGYSQVQGDGEMGLCWVKGSMMPLR